MVLGYSTRRGGRPNEDRPINRAMAGRRHGDSSCDATLSALVRRSSLTISRIEERRLPVAVCSADGVAGDFVRRLPSERGACCRGTTRRCAALHSTSEGSRRDAADHSLLTALLGAPDTAGAPSIALVVSRRKHS